MNYCLCTGETLVSFHNGTVPVTQALCQLVNRTPRTNWTVVASDVPDFFLRQREILYRYETDPERRVPITHTPSISDPTTIDSNATTFQRRRLTSREPSMNSIHGSIVGRLLQAALRAGMQTPPELQHTLKGIAAVLPTLRKATRPTNDVTMPADHSLGRALTAEQPPASNVREDSGRREELGGMELLASFGLDGKVRKRLIRMFRADELRFQHAQRSVHDLDPQVRQGNKHDADNKNQRTTKHRNLTANRSLQSNEYFQPPERNISQVNTTYRTRITRMLVLLVVEFVASRIKHLYLSSQIYSL